MPHALRLSGTNIVGFDRSRPQPLDEGWIYVEPEQFALAQSTPRPRLVDGEIVSAPEPEPPPPPPVSVSKLKLRRTLRDRGMEPLLDTLLASDPQIQADWTDAQFLLTSDPLLTASIPAFSQATGLPEADILALLESAAD